MRGLLRSLLDLLWVLVLFNIANRFTYGSPRTDGLVHAGLFVGVVLAGYGACKVPDRWYLWRRRVRFPESPTSPVVGWRAWRIREQTHMQTGATTYGLVSWGEIMFVWKKGGEPSQAYCGTMRSKTVGVICPKCRHLYTANGVPDPIPPCPRCLGRMVYISRAFDCHHPPEPDHTCGLWAYKGSHRAWRRATGCVLGVCLGWGRLQEHTDGWRAEYAMPVALVDSWWLRSRILTSERIHAVAREYAVPVVSMREAKRLARMWAEGEADDG